MSMSAAGGNGHGRWSPTAAASPGAGALTVGSPAGPVFSAPRPLAPRLDSPHSFFGGDLEAMERNLLVARRRQRAAQHAQRLLQQPAQAQQPAPPPPPPQQQHKAQPAVAAVEVSADTAAPPQPRAQQLPSPSSLSSSQQGDAVAEQHGKLADSRAQHASPTVPSSGSEAPAPEQPRGGQPGVAAASSGTAQQGRHRSQQAARPAPGSLPIVPEAAAVPSTEVTPLLAEAAGTAGAEECDLTAAMAALPAVRTSRSQPPVAEAAGRVAPPPSPPQQPAAWSPSRQPQQPGRAVPRSPHQQQPRSPAQPQLVPRSPRPPLHQPQQAPRSPQLQRQHVPQVLAPPPLPIVPRGPASDGQRSPKTFAAALRASSRSSSSTSLASPAAGHVATAASLASSPSKSAGGTPLAAVAGSRRPAWGRGSSGNLAALGSAPGAPSVAAAASAAPQQRSWSAVAAGVMSAVPSRKGSSASLAGKSP